MATRRHSYRYQGASLLLSAYPRPPPRVRAAHHVGFDHCQPRAATEVERVARDAKGEAERVDGRELIACEHRRAYCEQLLEYADDGDGER